MHLDLLIPEPSTTEHQTPHTQWLHRKWTSDRLSSHVMDLVLLLATSQMIVTLLIVSLIRKGTKCVSLLLLAYTSSYLYLVYYRSHDIQERFR
jgi:hypothetical protein